jgi:hypothetical protein
MDSSIPVGRIDIVGNGVVVWSFDVGGGEHFTGETTIDDAEGWYLAQVMDAGEEAQPLAMSNPIFIESE